MTPKVSIILIGYNEKRFLRSCLDGVMAQTYKDYEMIYIDNKSMDDSVEFVRKTYPSVKVVANPKNTGYVGAANQGMRMAKTPYVMILNPDLTLTPNYLKIVMKRMESDPTVASITGKVLKYDFKKNVPTQIIDTTGVVCLRNRRMLDRGQGSKDRGQYDEVQEVFAVSGACPLYRKKALEDVALPMLTRARRKDFDYKGVSDPQEFLDEDYFMYKEDMDLAWRLRIKGWAALYEPAALAYHGRGTGVAARHSVLQIHRGRAHLSRRAKHHSYINHRLTLLKNETADNLLRDIIPFAIQEIGTLLYIIVREPYLIKSVLTLILHVPRTLKKRRLIQANRVVDSKQIRPWLNGAPDQN